VRSASVRSNSVLDRSRSPQPIGDVVDFYDQDLKRAAIAILNQAFEAGGHAAIARLTARLFVSIGYTYGEDTLLKSLDEMAQQEIRPHLLDV
jgi:hypothetical protein